MSEPDQSLVSAFQAIHAIDYTVIIVRDMASMRNFYECILRFRLHRELSSNWIEYKLGHNTLALSNPVLTAADAPVPAGTAAVQLAFKVPVASVDECAKELEQKNVEIVSPPTNRDFGHRTLFFRDPDGNLLEVYAEI